MTQGDLVKVYDTNMNAIFGIIIDIDNQHITICTENQEKLSVMFGAKEYAETHLAKQ